MDSQLTMYITIVCFSGVFNVILAMYVFNKRKYIPVANVFVVYTIALAIYSFGSAFGLASSTLDEVMFWSVIQYIGMPFAPPLGLIIIMKYLDYKISKPSALALNIVPLITLIMISTNHFHHLYYKSMNTKEGLPVSFVTIEIGQWYIVHGIYTFGCMFIALLLLLARWKQTQKAYRPQVAILICAQFIPIVAAFLYLIGVTPVGLDLVPIVMCITSALFLWAIMSSNMLVVMPIAKETIFDSMEEGVIVLNSADRIFKRVNDEYGHAIGDQLLVQIAQIGKKLLPSDIIFARYGGEEFVMSLSSYSIERAVSIAEQMREELVQTSLMTEKGKLQISASFGVIQTSSQEETLDQLLRKVDRSYTILSIMGVIRLQRTMAMNRKYIYIVIRFVCTTCNNERS